ncbi:GGDEF domain-containing protein [Paracoccaceae bacterium GXU_MW_L88]
MEQLRGYFDRDQIAPTVPILAHLKAEMRVKLLFFLAYGMAMSIYSGAYIYGILGAGLGLGEWLFTSILLRGLKPKDNSISTGQIVLLTISTSIGFVGHGVIGLGISLHGEIPFLLFGVLWSVSALTHIANTYASFVFFMLIQFAIVLCGLVVQFVLIAGVDYSNGTTAQWLIAMSGMIGFIYNSYENLRESTRLTRAVAHAQAESQMRMRELEHLSHHDPLTDLLNRRAFDTRLELMLQRAEQHRPVEVIMIDLDGFKPVNDTFGHEAGDHVLKEVAKRLKALSTPDGIVGRIGGDEFILARVAPNTADTAEFAQDIYQALSSRVEWNRRTLPLQASIGVAVTHHPFISVQRICAVADGAMYKAKVAQGPPVIERSRRGDRGTASMAFG